METTGIITSFKKAGNSVEKLLLLEEKLEKRILAMSHNTRDNSVKIATIFKLLIEAEDYLDDPYAIRVTVRLQEKAMRKIVGIGKGLDSSCKIENASLYLDTREAILQSKKLKKRYWKYLMIYFKESVKYEDILKKLVREGIKQMDD